MNILEFLIKLLQTVIFDLSCTLRDDEYRSEGFPCKVLKFAKQAA